MGVRGPNNTSGIGPFRADTGSEAVFMHGKPALSHATPEWFLPAIYSGQFRQRRGLLPTVLAPSRAPGPSGARADRLALLPEA